MLRIILEVALGSLLYALGHPTFITLYPIPLFAPVGIFLLIKNIHFINIKRDLSNLLLFCFLINVIGFYWIAQTLQTFGSLPYLVSLLFSFLFSFLVLPQVWLIYFSLLIIRKFIPSTKTTPLTFFVALVILISLLEYFTPSQFPVHAGHPWMSWSFTLGLAPVFGLIIYNFLNYFFAFSLLFIFQNKDQFRFIPFMQATLLFIVCCCFKPLIFQEKTINSPKENLLKVKIVQANIGNFMKVDSELGKFSSLSEVFERYKNLSLTGDKSDLIIWPETAYPHSFNSDILENSPRSIPPLISSVLAETGSQMLIGAYDKGKLDLSGNAFQTVYNAAMLFDPSEGFLDVYHKKQLIPFGETLPFGPLTPYLVDYVPGVSYFSTGTRDTTFKLQNGHSFITPICYEILNTNLIRNMLNASSLNHGHINFILNLTNDSWYGLTAEPYQHLFLSKWRAVEFQKPIIRSTNSGITSLIDIDGKESERLLPGEEKSLDLNLYLPERPATIYQKIGLLSFMGFALFMLLINYFLDRILKPALKSS